MVVALSLAVVVTMAKSFQFTEDELASEESLGDLYERWRSHHKISRGLTEKQARFNVFKSNVHHIHKVNQMKKPYKLQLNKFADMTSHEFRNSYGSSKIKHYRTLHGRRDKTGFMHEQAENLPFSVDWRKKGAVTPVKDQGKCGKQVA